MTLERVKLAIVNLPRSLTFLLIAQYQSLRLPGANNITSVSRRLRPMVLVGAARSAKRPECRWNKLRVRLRLWLGFRLRFSVRVNRGQ